MNSNSPVENPAPSETLHQTYTEVEKETSQSPDAHKSSEDASPDVPATNENNQPVDEHIFVTKNAFRVTSDTNVDNEQTENRKPFEVSSHHDKDCTCNLCKCIPCKDPKAPVYVRPTFEAWTKIPDAAVGFKPKICTECFCEKCRCIKCIEIGKKRYKTDDKDLSVREVLELLNITECAAGGVPKKKHKKDSGTVKDKGEILPTKKSSKEKLDFDKTSAEKIQSPISTESDVTVELSDSVLTENLDASPSSSEETLKISSPDISSVDETSISLKEKTEELPEKTTKTEEKGIDFHPHDVGLPCDCEICQECYLPPCVDSKITSPDISVEELPEKTTKTEEKAKDFKPHDIGLPCDCEICQECFLPPCFDPDKKEVPENEETKSGTRKKQISNELRVEEDNVDIKINETTNLRFIPNEETVNNVSEEVQELIEEAKKCAAEESLPEEEYVATEDIYAAETVQQLKDPGKDSGVESLNYFEDLALPFQIAVGPISDPTPILGRTKTEAKDSAKKAEDSDQTESIKLDEEESKLPSGNEEPILATEKSSEPNKLESMGVKLAPHSTKVNEEMIVIESSEEESIKFSGNQNLIDEPISETENLPEPIIPTLFISNNLKLKKIDDEKVAPEEEIILEPIKKLDHVTDETFSKTKMLLSKPASDEEENITGRIVTPDHELSGSKDIKDQIFDKEKAVEETASKTMKLLLEKGMCEICHCVQCHHMKTKVVETDLDVPAEYPVTNKAPEFIIPENTSDILEKKSAAPSELASAPQVSDLNKKSSEVSESESGKSSAISDSSTKEMNEDNLSAKEIKYPHDEGLPCDCEACQCISSPCIEKNMKQEETNLPMPQETEVQNTTETSEESSASEI